MDIKAIVVDDEGLARARLKRMLSMHGVDVIADGENGAQAVDLVSKHDVDLLFIDINMPIKTGIEAVNEISETIDDPPAIVFCTAYDEYAIDAFQTNAVAYLLKPIQASDIAGAIEKASNINKFQREHLFEQQAGHKTLAIHHQGALRNMPIDRFLYFYSENKNVYAVLDTGEEVLVDHTLKTLEQDFAIDFVRSHRAYLVSRQKIARLVREESGAQLELIASDSRIPISRRHLSEVKKCFQ